MNAAVLEANYRQWTAEFIKHKPETEKILSKTLLMPRHQRIAKLYDDDFWVTH